MEKGITVKVSEDGKSLEFEQVGLTNFELLGILRHLEKMVWCQMATDTAKKQTNN